MVKNAMVASSKRHAEAMIAWQHLNPEEWEPLAYGDQLKRNYTHVRLVRPAAGIEQSHTDWVLEKLVPHIYMTCTTVPPLWRIPQEQVDS